MESRVGYNTQSMERILKLWGKADPESPETYHPLLYHMLDVVAVVQNIWEKVLGRRIKKGVVSKISGAEPEKWIFFIAALHDIGKACPSFQRKVSFHKLTLEAEGYKFPRIEDRPHNLLSLQVIKNFLQSGEMIREKADVFTAINWAMMAGGHHGLIPTHKEISDVQEENLGGDLWVESRVKIIVELAEVIGFSLERIPRINEEHLTPVTVFLLGLITVADWVGSSEDFFPYQKPVYSALEYFEIAGKRAREAVNRLSWEHLTSREKTPIDLFVFPNLRPLQSSTLEFIKEMGEPGLIIIEAPTGEGKTEAAMLAYNEWQRMCDGQGLYVGLPTQATADQMFGRIKEFLGRSFPEDVVNLQLLHGNASILESFQEMIVRDSVGEDEGVVIANEWFTFRKRGLLGPFGVGTVDQTLMSVLPTRHFYLRLFGMAGKTVVIDEVHAYDTYMSSLLDRVLDWLSALGSSVVLLSATLPMKRRVELVRAYGGREAEVPPVPYPRITGTGAKVVLSRKITVSPENIRTVEIEWINDSIEDMITLIGEKLRDGGCCALVCNTVKRAQTAYRELQEPMMELGIDVDLFHARYPFEGRMERQDRCLDRFDKKDRDSKNKYLLIATQVIEQSLDLDFDLMISELAPVDLLLQRMGRLQRHKREYRPHHCRTPTIVIVKPPTNDEGLPMFGPERYFYYDYILLKSLVVLRRYHAVRVPEDVEDMVEGVYGDVEPEYPDESWAREAGKKKFDLEHRYELDGYKALVNMIRGPDEEDPAELFEVRLLEDEPDAHPSRQAMTRLSQETVSLICMFQTERGLSLDQEGMEIPDTQNKPNRKLMVRLFQRGFKISDRRIVDHFREAPVLMPEAWGKIALLRHYRIADFSREATGKWIKVCGKAIMEYHDELGIITERTEESK